jgi:hypothetical protein
LSARSTLESADARDDRIEHRAHALGQLRALARAGRIGARAGLRQPDHPQLQRRRVVQLLGVGEDHLERAASQVDLGEALLAEIDRAARAQVDEPRLLVAADDADVDARLVARRAHELAAVLGLAHSAGGDGGQRVDVVAIGDAAERPQRVQPAPEHLRRDDAVVERRVAEADHLLRTVEHVDVPAGADIRDDEVKRVRTDVERGDAHLPITVIRSPAPSEQHLRQYSRASGGRRAEAQAARARPRTTTSPRG